MGSETHRCRCKEKKEVNGKPVLAKLDFRPRVCLMRFVFQSGEPLRKLSTVCLCQHSCVSMYFFFLFFPHICINKEQFHSFSLEKSFFIGRIAFQQSFYRLKEYIFPSQTTKWVFHVSSSLFFILQQNWVASLGLLVMEQSSKRPSHHTHMHYIYVYKNTCCPEGAWRRNCLNCWERDLLKAIRIQPGHICLLWIQSVCLGDTNDCNLTAIERERNELVSICLTWACCSKVQSIIKEMVLCFHTFIMSSCSRRD